MAMTLSAQQLMDHAFGRQLLEGKDEWRGVADVVRSSFLLLYSELRRQAKRVARVEAHGDSRCRDERILLMSEQMELLREELRLLKSEVHALRSGDAGKMRRKCTACSKEAVQKQVTMQVAAYARVHVQRHEKLRRKVIKLQSRLHVARRVQHECEEIVVRTAELQQRQVRQLSQRVRDEARKRQVLEVDVRDAVIPRVTQIEKHVAALSGQSIHCGRQRDMEEYKHGEEPDSEVSERENERHTPQKIPIEIPALENELQSSHHTGLASEDAQSDSERAENARTRLSTGMGHASLRRRYQHERSQQLRRLDRLRRGRTSTLLNLSGGGKDAARLGDRHRARVPQSAHTLPASPRQPQERSGRLGSTRIFADE